MPATYYKYEKAATMAANRIMDLACNNKYEKAATMAANIIMEHQQFVFELGRSN